MAEVLTAYCHAGGKLVMGARTGYKDQYGRCVTMPMPGYAAVLCGVTVEEYSLPRPEEQAALLWDGASYAATGFQETLKANGSQVLARYDSGWLKGEAALCEKSIRRAVVHGTRAPALPKRWLELSWKGQGLRILMQR